MSERIKVALMADVIDRRPERTMVARRLAEYLLTRPEIELTLIHYEKMSDDPLYARAREIIIQPVTFPFRSRFLSFLRFALTTKEKFDIVHWLVGRVYPFFWFLPTRATIVTAHDGGGVLAPGPRIPSRFIYNKVLSFFHSHIAAVVGVSDFGSDQIAQAYGISRSKIHTVYPGVDAAYHPRVSGEIEAALSRHGLKSGGYVLYVGGMQTHKNVPTLIRAYTRYCNAGRKEKLVLVGNPSYGLPALEEALAASSYRADVIQIRFTDDLPVLYNGALMYVHPSLNEGFGLPPVEAMASGTPVISSNATSLPEVVDGAALLIDPHDVGAMAEAMIRLAGDDTLRAELTLKGIGRAGAFTWEKMGEAYVALYRAVLDKNVQ